METKDIEKVVMQQAAAAFINGMPEETRVALMNQAMETVLSQLITSYSVKQAIAKRMEADMLDYVEEYLEDPEIQERLEKSAHELLTGLFGAVQKSVRTDLRNNMKSKYELFEDKA